MNIVISTTITFNDDVLISAIDINIFIITIIIIIMMMFYIRLRLHT